MGANVGSAGSDTAADGVKNLRAAGARSVTGAKVLHNTQNTQNTQHRHLKEQTVGVQDKVGSLSIADIKRIGSIEKGKEGENRALVFLVETSGLKSPKANTLGGTRDVLNNAAGRRGVYGVCIWCMVYSYYSV